MDGSLVSDVPVESASARWVDSPLARMLRGPSGKHALAVLDQAVVSGTSFLTTILLGRWCGAGELGVYSLGFSLLVTWGCVQESLIAMPYTIYRHRPMFGSAAEYAGGVLVHQLLLSGLAAITLVVCGLVLSVTGAAPGLAGVTWVLAAVMPFALLREFGRRYAFAHLRMGEAFALDAAVAVLQLSGLAAFAAAGGLSADTAFATVGLACGLIGAAWFYLTRRNFVIRGGEWRRILRQSWTLGRWIFAGQLSLAVQAYFIQWLLFWTMGKDATGVYAACLTVAQFSNPLILGISNALSPRTALAVAAGGGEELRRVVVRTTLLLAAAMAVFCLIVLVNGDGIMALLYHGRQQFAGHGHAVTVLALAMFATAVGMPASNALTAIERPDMAFKVGLVALVLSVILGPALAAGWGVTGAAYAFLAGTAAGALGRWLAFTTLVKHRRRPLPAAAVTRVLQEFIPGGGEGGWIIEPLNEGVQANLFAVRRPSDPDLVVKVYKPDAGKQAAEIGEQFKSMAQFHAKLDGRSVNGWAVRTPEPLFRSDEPSALVMTRVPGMPLNDCLRTLPPAALPAIGEAIVAGMGRTWAVESQIHGDFNFDNILCDLETRTLSFVDPGIQPLAFAADGVARRWYPASRDLAHLLFETAAGIKRMLASPGIRRRQRELAEHVLRAYLRQTVPAVDQPALLDEVHACARVYLASLKSDWTPRGVWRRIVRQIATRRIDELLRELRDEIKASVGREADVGTMTLTRRPHGRRSPSLLAEAFTAFERAGVPHCVLHGYDEYPQRADGDVDCIVAAAVGPHGVATVLRHNSVGEVIRCLSGHVVIAGRDDADEPCFLDLDVSGDYVVAGRHFYSGKEILAGRRRHGSFWLPAVSIEFGCLLVRRIGKADLSDHHARRLGELYRQDPAGCREQIARFWGNEAVSALAAAAESGDWQPVRRDLQRLRGELLRRATVRHPLRFTAHKLSRLIRPVYRYLRPAGGVSVILLGPDGAGKSSLITTVQKQLAGAFSATNVLMFPPAIFRRMLRRAEGPVTLPHALPARSALSSVLRAVGYWFTYYTVGYWLLFRPALAKSTLLLHDRHMIDGIVDQTRYRYSGPVWLLELISRIIPKTDLVILLDAPAEVLQARKREVSFEETARQRKAYLALAAGLRDCHVVNADQPPEAVAGDVTRLILGVLSRRGKS